MPKRRSKPAARDDDAPARPHGPRPFWSGIITFGLVSLPVSLYVATRPQKVSLRMVDEAGEPLARRYFCPNEDKALDSDEIVRGYEVEPDEFVVVSDEELDAIAPEKSKEIDLRRFVPLDDIDPMYFERAYFLAPGEGATKPYRLLARSMEATGRAGIATCVIRGTEYLIAILSEHGILRAEILRFADELRSPEDVGLTETSKPDAAVVKRMEKSIQKESGDTLDADLLADPRSARLLALVDKKLKSGKDVYREPEAAAAEAPSEDNEPVDLMALLKASLADDAQPGGQSPASRHKKTANGASKTDGKGRSAAATESRSREELYEQARKLDIPGRSKMSKEELAAAIKAA